MASPIETNNLRPLEELPPIVSSPEPSEERGADLDDDEVRHVELPPTGSNLGNEQQMNDDEQFYCGEYDGQPRYDGSYDSYNMRDSGGLTKFVPKSSNFQFL